MHPITAFIRNPVKVTVGVLLLTLFGTLAMFGMPVQLSPDVDRPTITVSTTWPGASPNEVEKEIVKEQEEQLKSVQGIVKMTSESAESNGTVTLEFSVGTDLQEALLKVNSQLQQVPEYPTDADEPVIRTTDPNANAIAWMILSARPASDDEIRKFAEQHPEARERVEWVLRSRNQGLKVFRLTKLAEEFPAALNSCQTLTSICRNSASLPRTISNPSLNGFLGLAARTSLAVKRLSCKSSSIQIA